MNDMNVDSELVESLPPAVAQIVDSVYLSLTTTDNRVETGDTLQPRQRRE